MLSYPSTISLSSRTLNHLADRIRRHRNQRRSRWRRLDAGRQALLALAHLRSGDTYTRLAAGFAVGVTTAWRYVQEAIALLAAAADDLAAAMNRVTCNVAGVRASWSPVGCAANDRHWIHVCVAKNAWAGHYRAMSDRRECPALLVLGANPVLRCPGTGNPQRASRRLARSAASSCGNAAICPNTRTDGKQPSDVGWPRR